MATDLPTVPVEAGPARTLIGKRTWGRSASGPKPKVCSSSEAAAGSAGAQSERLRLRGDNAPVG